MESLPLLDFHSSGSWCLEFLSSNLKEIFFGLHYNCSFDKWVIFYLLNMGTFYKYFIFASFFCNGISMNCNISHWNLLRVMISKFWGSTYINFLCIWTKSYIWKFLFVILHKHPFVDFVNQLLKFSVFVANFIGLFYQLLRKLYILLLPFVSIFLSNSISFYSTCSRNIY